MRPILLLCALVVMSGCEVVSYHASGWGEVAKVGQTFETDAFSYKVAQDRLRVWIGPSELRAYEDYGISMGSGRVLSIVSGPALSDDNVVTVFSGLPNAPKFIKEAKIRHSEVDTWNGHSISVFLLEIPEKSRQMDANSRIVDRERLWIELMLVHYREGGLWVSLISNDEFFDKDVQWGGKNRAAFLEFIEGLRIKEVISSAASTR
jgi:hypothetical protein